MRKNAFTLIELLAVIVILAIIALIAVPVIVNIITDSKASSEKESIKIYLDTVEKARTRRMFAKPTFNPTECTISGNKEITCGTEEIEIDIKGEVPSEGKIKFGNGMIIEGINLKLNGLYYQVTGGKVSEGVVEKVVSYSDYITKVSDADHDGKVSPGDEYTYKVNATDTFTFYVLSIEGNKVNLIMDRNICNDGSITYTSTNNYCRYAWQSNSVNGNGPIDAMTALGNGTRNWNNVPNMNLEYNDITDNTSSGYTEITTYGYTGMTITNGTGYITKKDGTTQTPITLTDNMPIKARLPKLKEITEAGCHVYSSNADYGTCPVWLMGYMTYHNVSSYTGSGNTDKYSMNNINEAYQNQIYGYWLLSSNPGNSDIARSVGYRGGVSDYSAFFTCYHGVRAVITVSKSDL